MGIAEVNGFVVVIVNAAGSRVSRQPMSRSHIAIAAESAMTDRADYPLRTLRLCDSALKS